MGIEKPKSENSAALAATHWTQLVPDFRKAFLAIERVEKLLHDFTTALDTAGVPYAIIGGNAVAAWVSSVDPDAVRSTKDVDVLLRRADMDAVTRAVAPLGLVPDEVLGIPIFVDKDNPSPKRSVHVTFAGEKLGSNPGMIAPDVEPERRSGQGYRVVSLADLLHMKLIAFRLHDRVHMQDMFELGLITAELAAGLPTELLVRLRQVRDEMEWHTPKPEF